jgi:hypothetical protein
MTRARKQIEMPSFQELDADELNNSVREMLVLMEALERKLFIKTLEYEMSRSGLSIRPYLIPLGIAAAYAEDLTPSEVGHLIRFFKINVPKAMPAVWRVLAGCPVLATGSELVTEWLLKATMQEACDRNELRT